MSEFSNTRVPENWETKPCSGQHDAGPDVGHGVGSTKTYYDKWDQLTKDEIQKVEAEEKKLVKEAEAALGNHLPSSAAEQAAKEKNEALKKAKLVWEARKKTEQQMMYLIEAQNDQGSIRVDRGLIEDCRVITIKNCTNSNFVFPAELTGAIKLFVEDCKDVNIDVSCIFMTSNIEVIHCSGCTLNLRQQVKTLQIDLCEGISVNYLDAGEMCPLVGASASALYSNPGAAAANKLYWAACNRLTVASAGRTCSIAGYAEEVAAAGGLQAAESTEEVQFVVHLVPVGGAEEGRQGIDGAGGGGGLALVSDRVVRTPENLPSTAREMGLAGEGPEAERRRRAALAAVTEAAKAKGNEYFKAGENAQAAIEYTRALENAKLHDYDKMHVLYANRAFCFSKLGEHAKALVDGEAAAAADATYAKGWFRKGIALHALGRYQEACPALGRALELEPRNKAIQDALRFAEMRAARGGPAAARGGGGGVGHHN